MNEHQIQIGAVSQFAAAELAVTNSRHIDHAALRIGATHWNAKLRRHLLPAESHRALDNNLGDLGQPVADLHQRQAATQISNSHPEDGSSLPLHQHFNLPLRVVTGHGSQMLIDVILESISFRNVPQQARIEQLI